MTELERDLRTVKRALREAGVPTRLVTAIETRALRSGRRQTGHHRTNRASRWTLGPEDPQYGTREDCQTILLRLLGMLLEFHGAPRVNREVEAICERYLAHALTPDSYRDPLTRERLSYRVVLDEIATPRHGVSAIHIGHRDPRMRPRHTPENVEWRSHRSNLIQGDLTLREARSKFVELIARYFELGEVRIEPD